MKQEEDVITVFHGREERAHGKKKRMGIKKKFHRHSKNIIFQPKLISSSKSISLK